MESKKARRAANGQEAYVPPAARAATGALTRHAASTPSLPAAAAAAANGSAANGSAAKGSGSHAGQFRVAAGPSGDGKGFGGIARRILMQDHAASEPDLPSLGGEAEAASDDTATEENGSDKVRVDRSMCQVNSSLIWGCLLGLSRYVMYASRSCRGFAPFLTCKVVFQTHS